MITSKKIVSEGELVFSAGVNEEHAISCMLFCNTSELSSAFLDVYAVPGTDETAWMNDIGLVVKNVKIKPMDTFVFDTEKLVLSDGDAIRASIRYDDPSSIDAVVATVSSVRVR